MPYPFKLIVHSNQEMRSFPAEVEDKEYETAEAPTSERNSTSDAVWFRELQSILCNRLFLSADNTLTRDDYKQVALLGKEKSVAFGYDTNYVAHYANLLQLHAVPYNLAQNYPHDCFSDKDPATKKYFDKLGIKASDRHKTPEFYLRKNVEAGKTDKLLHVRECEYHLCSLHPDSSPLIKSTNENTIAQVLKFITEQQKDKTKTIFYGGFASGHLKRDLDIIKELINLGYKNFKFFFIDPSYKKLFQLTETVVDLDINSQLEVNLNHKAIVEFSNWIAAHIGSTEKNPLEIHLFADIKDAQHHFSSVKQDQLTVLVGQDYWTKDGCDSYNPEKDGTPQAHSDFDALAISGLAKDGCSFELMKDDTVGMIYFRMGAMSDYTHKITHEIHINSQKMTTTTGSLLSLGLFAKSSCAVSTVEANAEEEVDADQLIFAA